MSEFIRVCRADEIPEGEARLFVVEGQQIGVFRSDGEYFALSNQCPHAGASLAHGIICDGIVRCRIHHWQFRIRDGQYMDENQPAHDVTTYPTRVVDGEVQVRVGD